MSIPAVVVKITGKAPLLATISQNRYCNVISEWKFSKSAALQEVMTKKCHINGSVVELLSLLGWSA